tara:strand:- start:44691 stop:45026 length:336 start_codon:yes stop_codon:yes gene_type:complete
VKKVVFFLIISFAFIELAYSSFPILENNMSELSALMVEDDDSNEEFSLSVRILLSILILSAIGFSAYVVLKTWIKAWKDKVKWVRVLTKALFIVLSILTLFVLWLSYELNS